jgi:hypothetical protein
MKTLTRKTYFYKIYFVYLNYCFTVHFDKFNTFLPTNALFIKT